jgi:hypothetical protein
MSIKFTQSISPDGDSTRILLYVEGLAVASAIVEKAPSQTGQGYEFATHVVLGIHNGQLPLTYATDLGKGLQELAAICESIASHWAIFPDQLLAQAYPAPKADQDSRVTHI